MCECVCSTHIHTIPGSHSVLFNWNDSAQHLFTELVCLSATGGLANGLQHGVNSSQKGAAKALSSDVQSE